MQNTRISSSDYLGRYYTQSLVGNTLIKAMNLTQPNIIMDLGAGEGALTEAAAKIWTNSKFITVDIDSTRITKQVNNNHISFYYDALKEELPELLGIPLGSIDGAICNPPYIQPTWRNEFRTILEESGFSDIFSSRNKLSAEVLFIAQNLRFLKSHGKLGLILPDGILTGQNYLEFRKNLITQHCVERVIELPRKIFKKTDAKAHILVLTKDGKSEDNIFLHKLNENGSISKPIAVDNQTAIKRMDYSYAENCSSSTLTLDKKPTRLGDLTEFIKRGHMSSAQVRSSTIQVFHSTNFPLANSVVCTKVPSAFILSKKIASTLKTNVATKGDILICRVGRNLENKVCYVSRGNVAISDCVFMLRAKPPFQTKLLKFLSSNEGRRCLNAISHGVGAKHFSINDIQNLLINEID